MGSDQFVRFFFYLHGCGCPECAFVRKVCASHRLRIHFASDGAGTARFSRKTAIDGILLPMGRRPVRTPLFEVAIATLLAASSPLPSQERPCDAPPARLGPSRDLYCMELVP